MSDCLAYWKLFWEKKDKDYLISPFEWHTNDRYFHMKTKVGENLWVVTSGGLKYPGEWRLVMRISIQTLDENPSSYGKYHALGNIEKSQLFDINNQVDLKPILYDLEFSSGKKIHGNGRNIGNELQSIRPLSQRGNQVFENYAATLLLGNEIKRPSAFDIPLVRDNKGVDNNNLYQHKLVDQEISRIRGFLNGQIESQPGNEKLCDWVHFCYSFELFREAVDLFAYIELTDVNPWYYERTRKLWRLCSLRTTT
jgi:hypothetical protein